jgi:hypothetical protein
MITDLIAGLNQGDLKPKVFSVLQKESAARQEGSAKPTVPGLQADRLQLSEAAKSAYTGEDNKPGMNQGFEDRFKAALLQFTEYALHINGFTGAPNGQHNLLALHVLARKSGITMPMNINTGKAELLQAFKAEWGLDENASVEEIYDRMVRVFGEDRSFGQSGPGAAPTAGVENPADVPPEDSSFREALTVFTSQLFEKNGVFREPGPRDFRRVLDVLSDKLGIDGRQGDVARNVERALGLSLGASVQEIVTAMARAFNL